MNLPSELVLDYKIWRCGGCETYRSNLVGEGYTSLLNSKGYMCCLGQFCQQAGVVKHLLLHKIYPSYLHFTPKLFASTGHDTNLAVRAAEINDNEYITTAERVVKLQKLFMEYDRTIVLKNFPKDILQQIEELTNQEAS